METLESATSRPTCVTSSLGDLLSIVRDEAGLSVAEMGSSGPLTVEQVLEVESSRYDLSPAELATVMNSYGVPSAGARFARHVVVINLEDGWISLKPTRRFWEHTADADQNLLRYLSLLHRHQGLSIGDRVPLRAVDLALLRASLALRRDEVETHLGRLGGGLPGRVGRNKNLLAFAAAGIAVAAGAIVLVPGTAAEKSAGDRSTAPDARVVPAVESAGGGQPEAGASGPQIDIGTAVVIQRNPAAATGRDDSGPPAGAAAVDPQIDIGTALVIERAGATPASVSQPETAPRSSRGPPDRGTAEPKGSN